MIQVYTANRPPLSDYLTVGVLNNMLVGEIKHVANETGNHWRKIFNVYAKFIFALAGKTKNSKVLVFKTWQGYRDERLLQKGSETELVFDSLSLQQSMNHFDGQNIRIVMGKGYAEVLLSGIDLSWLDTDFAISDRERVVVCPYFDYRQLSNVKIERLVNIVWEMMNEG